MNAETVLQNQIRCALSTSGICVRLNTGIFRTDDGRSVRCGIPGMPDLLWIGPDGKTAWIEVKTETGKIRQGQKQFIDRLIAMGHTAGIARSVDDALKLVKEVREL